MLFERFEDKGLSQYSYLLACEQAGVAAVIDPRRDVDEYLEFAHARNLRIVSVLETHIHADFASGARELAHRTGAELWLSGHDSGEVYEVAFPHREARDGDALELGRVRIVARHTPGHTPEHLAFLVYDTARTADAPQLMLSGDFLFIGSLGRPDLIGEDAKVQLAHQLFDSVARLADLPDGLEIHPGHGAGSMCGAGMSARPMSTLGFERIANPYLNRALTRDAFVERILGSVPPFPPYYRRMKVLNAAGPPLLDTLPAKEALEPARFRSLAGAGHAVIDLRDPLAFGAAHVPGAFAIGLAGSLSTWAAWVVPYDTPLLLVADGPDDVEPAVRALVRVGLDAVRGYLDGGMEAWMAAGFHAASTAQAAPREVSRRLASGDLTLVDVRNDDEWKSGHVAGARHVMGGHLADQVHELPRDGAVAVMCASGYRSAVAASVLERAGFTNVINVVGGTTAWEESGLPMTAG